MALKLETPMSTRSTFLHLSNFARINRHVDIFLLILLLASAAMPRGAQAVQAINWLNAEPAQFDAETSATILVTTQVAPDPGLISESVNLIRYNYKGQVVGTPIRMYDDGTHGDQHIKDGIFSVATNINEAKPQKLLLQVSVAYRGVLKRVLSEPFAVLVKTHVPPEYVLTSVSEKLRIGDIDGVMEYFSDSDSNRTALRSMTDEGRKQLADYFDSGQIIEDKGDLRIYTGTLILPSLAPKTLEFWLMRNELGQWFITNW
jgi:hypothetical protein